MNQLPDIDIDVEKQELSLMSHFRLTGFGVSGNNVPSPEPNEVKLTQKELSKLIAKRNGHKVRSGYTNNKLTKSELKRKRKNERARKRKARN